MFKAIFKYTFGTSLGLISLITLLSYTYISINAGNKTFNSLSELPNNKYYLLLGTSKFMDNGDINLFFTYRCNAVVELWKNHKIEQIIISGDSASPQYDEPALMKEELLKRGISDSVIIMDKQGFNTKASILFCKKNNIQNLTIISQKFHNERAIVIAKHYEINAVGYNAKSVYTGYGIRVWIREWFARVKLVFELICCF